jgi:predicted LPLAT superfamily acyltransferase
MKQKISIPVLKDHHNHPSIYAVFHDCLNLQEIKEKSEAMKLLQSLESEKVSVVLGWNTGFYRFSDEELDRFPPVIIVNISLHSFIINPAAAAMLRVLRGNGILGFLIDQDTDVRGVFVDFYGKPAYTPIGAAMLAMDSGAPVLPMFYLKKPDDTYEFVIEKEITLVMTGNRRQDMEENTRRFHEVIEKYIKKYPTQWVWMHNRWKTTPEMVAEKRKKKSK